MTEHRKGWNPDAVVPPIGDVYERERRRKPWAYTLGRLLAVAFLMYVVWFLTQIG